MGRQKLTDEEREQRREARLEKAREKRAEAATQRENEKAAIRSEIEGLASVIPPMFGTAPSIRFARGRMFSTQQRTRRSFAHHPLIDLSRLATR